MLIRPLVLVAAVAAALTLCGSASAHTVSNPAATTHTAFVVKYSFDAGRFTKLTATSPVQVKVKRPHRSAQVTTLKKLIGKKLPVGTKITVSRDKAKLTLTIGKDGVR
jgi:hypothetical protein